MFLLFFQFADQQLGLLVISLLFVHEIELPLEVVVSFTEELVGLERSLVLISQSSEGPLKQIDLLGPLGRDVQRFLKLIFQIVIG